MRTGYAYLEDQPQETSILAAVFSSTRHALIHTHSVHADSTPREPVPTQTESNEPNLTP